MTVAFNDGVIYVELLLFLGIVTWLCVFNLFELSCAWSWLYGLGNSEIFCSIEIKVSYFMYNYVL